MAKPTKSRRSAETRLRSAETRLRDRARTLVREIDERYWELGRVLYEVYNEAPGGYRGFKSGEGSMRSRGAMFKRWGYKNFGDYCERGLGIKKRTGENLRYAYHWFAIHQVLPAATINQLITLGRSKVYLLSGFATDSNISLWIKRANSLSFEALKRAIGIAKTGDVTRGARRSLRVDVCVLVRYFCNIELFLKRHGKKIPEDVQDIVKWYEDQAGVKVGLKLVA